MNLFRALSYKEWMKTRRLIGVMLLLMAAAVGYTYIDLTHEIRLNEAVNVWYGCLFQGTSVCPVADVSAATGRNCTGSRAVCARDDAETAEADTPSSGRRNTDYGLHAVVWFQYCLVAFVCCFRWVLSAVVCLFLPSEIVGMMLQQLLPWMVAAVAGYGFTAWICIEPQWKQRMLCIVVSVGLLSMLFVSSYPGAYSQFGAGICWILAELLLSFLSHPAFGSRMVYNKKTMNNEIQISHFFQSFWCLSPCWLPGRCRHWYRK